ncbi:DUF2892 domain-containing protein [Rurimicrobium arvi]|uniref:Inner membrane protein YgaP-like transmembrane domain-containing protein n=1 Tax=Rurimicrobium arvi TaxID=2049916 RepID=A0ABP8MYX0_9BACT
MKQNVGPADKLIRILAAIVIGALYLSGRISGAVAIVLAIVAIVFLLTGLIGFCPLYLPFGISTRKKQQ